MRTPEPSRATSSAPARATSSAPARATSSAPARATSSAPARATSSAPARATSGAPSGAPSRATLLALFLAALALRLLYVAVSGAEQETPGLSRKYQVAAGHVLAGEGFWLQVGSAPIPFCDRLPGYVVILAAITAVGGTSWWTLVGAHAALGAGQAPVLAALAGRLGGRRAGLAAGVLVAAWPPLWKADVQFMETGASGLALALLLLGLSSARFGARAPVLLVALAATAAFTLRPDAMLVPLVAAAILVALARSLRAAAAVALFPLLVAIPWAVRNARVADGPFVSVGLGANLLGALGESIATTRPLLDDRGVARTEGYDSLFWPDPARRDRERVRLAVSLIREHPMGYARGCVKRLAVSLSQYQGRLWPWGTTPEEDLARWRLEHRDAPRHAGIFRSTLEWGLAHPVVGLLTLAWGPALVGLAGWAGWRLRRRPTDLVLLLALPVHGLLVHVPLHAEPRYFMPYVGSLLALAAIGWTARREEASGHEVSPHARS